MRLLTKVWHSPQVHEELARLAGDASLDSETLVRAVKTRWNTVTDVLERALEIGRVLRGERDVLADVEGRADVAAGGESERDEV